jgi:hypothetical protein
VLKFSVQTFYLSLFSHSFPFQKLPSPKKPKAKVKSQSPQKTLQSKNFVLPFSGSFYTQWQSVEQRLGEGHDIVTGETCISAFLKANNLGETAVLLSGLCQSTKSRWAILSCLCLVLIGFNLLSTTFMKKVLCARNSVHEFYWYSVFLLVIEPKTLMLTHIHN